ncbi:hypothetical protein, partial [Frankia sp. Cppng1_Ct_nod]|uniref:hypothetical protein n=1 Tax=Frankia sp. Cppng1_Ct_nod TaxID=2897162 RepID=UPI0020251876
MAGFGTGGTGRECVGGRFAGRFTGWVLAGSPAWWFVPALLVPALLVPVLLAGYLAASRSSSAICS